MNRFLTVITALLAVGLLSWAITLRSCARAPDDGLLLSLDPGRIHTIRVRSGGAPFTLKRRGPGWQVATEHFKDTADPEAVAKLAEIPSALFYYDKISAAEIKKGGGHGPFGLRSPRQWVEFEERGRHRLLLGKESALEGRIYARLDGADDVFVISDTILALLPNDDAFYRSKVLTDLETEQADKIIFRDATGEIELVRSPGGWRLSKPLSAPADSAAVERFLRTLFQLPVEAFLADDAGDLGFYGIEEGKYELAVSVEGRPRPLVLRFGHVPSEFPDSIIAQFTGRDAIIRVPQRARSLLNVQPDSFRDRRLLPLNMDLVDRIRIAGPEGSFQLGRTDSAWELRVNGDEGIPANPAVVARLAELLSAATVSEFSRQALPEGVPVTSIEFFSVLSENTPEAAAGVHPVAGLQIAADKDGPLAIAVNGQPGTCLVDRELLIALPTEVSDY